MPRKALVEQARGGDPEAFHQLVAPYRSRLEGIIRLRLGPGLRSQVDVDDALQETLIRAHASLGRLEWRDEPSLFRWLATIARRVVQDLTRRHARAVKATADREVPPSRPARKGAPSAATLEDLLQASGASPKRALRRGERLARLQRALDSLSAEHREAILLAHVERVPPAEVAARMGRSRQAAAMLLLRALRALREAFGATESLRLPRRRREGAE